VTVVQKYGGTSVGSVERLRNVARRVAARAVDGEQIAVVVSAMGKTTDELLTLAREVNPRPPRRETDLLMATGEMVSSASSKAKPAAFWATARAKATSWSESMKENAPAKASIYMGLTGWLFRAVV